MELFSLCIVFFVFHACLSQRCGYLTSEFKCNDDRNCYWRTVNPPRGTCEPLSPWERQEMKTPELISSQCHNRAQYDTSGSGMGCWDYPDCFWNPRIGCQSHSVSNSVESSYCTHSRDAMACHSNSLCAWENFRCIPISISTRPDKLIQPHDMGNTFATCDQIRTANQCYAAEIPAMSNVGEVLDSSPWVYCMWMTGAGPPRSGHQSNLHHDKHPTHSNNALQPHHQTHPDMELDADEIYAGPAWTNQRYQRRFIYSSNNAYNMGPQRPSGTMFPPQSPYGGMNSEAYGDSYNGYNMGPQRPFGPLGAIFPPQSGYGGMNSGTYGNSYGPGNGMNTGGGYPMNNGFSNNMGMNNGYNNNMGMNTGPGHCVAGKFECERFVNFQECEGKVFHNVYCRWLEDECEDFGSEKGYNHAILLRKKYKENSQEIKQLLRSSPQNQKIQNKNVWKEDHQQKPQIFAYVILVFIIVVLLTTSVFMIFNICKECNLNLIKTSNRKNESSSSNHILIKAITNIAAEAAAIVETNLETNDLKKLLNEQKDDKESILLKNCTINETIKKINNKNCSIKQICAENHTAPINHKNTNFMNTTNVKIDEKEIDI